MAISEVGASKTVRPAIRVSHLVVAPLFWACIIAVRGKTVTPQGEYGPRGCKHCPARTKRRLFEGGAPGSPYPPGGGGGGPLAQTRVVLATRGYICGHEARIPSAGWTFFHDLQ
jgi:hypothetical protein